MKNLYLLLVAFGLVLGTNGQTFSPKWAMGIGSNNSENATASVVDFAGNIYVTGTFGGTIDFDPGPGTVNLTSNGNTDIFIIKLNPSGGLIWAKSIGGTSNDFSVDLIYQNSTLYITGYYQGLNVDFDPGTSVFSMSSAGQTDIFVLALSNSGNFQWAKSMGGTNADIAHKIAWDPSQGKILIAGEFSGTCDFDPSTSVANKTSSGSSDAFVLKLSSTGTFEWVQSIGGSSPDMANSIEVSSSGDIYFGGTFEGGIVDFDPGTGTHNVSTSGYMADIYVEKLNSSGIFQWVKTFGGFDGERLQAMTMDASGNIYTTGDFFMQVDFDPGTGIYNLTSHNGNDVFVQKLDPNGNFLWARSFGGNSPDLSTAIQTDNQGNVYTYGRFSSQKIDLNPNSDSLFFMNSYMQGDDIFIQKLDSNGGFVTAFTFGGTWFDISTSFTIDDSTNLVLLGNFESDTISLNTAGISDLINQGSNDGFIIKFHENKPEIIPSQSVFSAPPFSVSFQNNTGDSTNIRWFWNFGDGNFSNLMNPIHTYAYNGNYHVILLALDTLSNNSDTTSTYISCSGGSTNNYAFTAELQQTGAAIICANDSFRLSATSGANYTYTWLHNGIIIPGAHDSVYWGQPQGFYMAVISNANYSQTTNYFALANYPSSTPYILSQGSISPCSNDSIKLYTSNYNSYLWSTGETTPEIYVSTSGRYVVKGIDNNGCTNTSTEKIINASLANIPEICIVGFDSLTNHNVVVWNAPISNKIDSFKVYRESTVTNVYDLIGAEPYAGNHYFEDLTSNTSVKQYKYRITSLDTCGTETPMSNPHSTIHLMVNAAIGDHWNLIWRPYEGISVSSYKIYRGNDSLNLQLITQVSGNSYSYTDLNNPTGNIYYQIEAITNSSCSIFNKVKSNAFNTSNASGVGFQSITNKIEGIKVYPNPNNGRFSIEFTTPINDDMVLHIYDLLGREIHAEIFASPRNKVTEIDLSAHSKGVYLMVIVSKNHKTYRGKIIIQ